MCGINGIFAFNRSANSPDRMELLATRDHMSARGPDGSGEWWSEDRRLGLGHRRLSILDLSDRAAQPMMSACGRFVVVFNGEIYNYPELRRQLEAQGRSFRTTSDTEVLLHLYALKGAEMVQELRGMFAFAIWDNQARGLFLARDPYGIKPLYTSNDGWTFRFASQVKALLAGGKVSRDPEPAGIVGFHLWGSVPEPFTLYRDVRQLLAGHTQWIDELGPREPRQYCSISAILAEGAEEPCPADEAVERLQAALKDSVRAHLLADVEVGLFLSRGVDSGALLGIVSDIDPKHKVRSLTLGFDEFQGTPEDEVPVAREVAVQYGSTHQTRFVRREEFEADLQKIFEAMDQPTIDGVNMWFIAKAARENGHKVALSGLGGDEILAGYSSFLEIPKAVSLLRLPASIPGLGGLWQVACGLLRLDAELPKLKGLVRYGGTYSGAYLLRRGLFLPFELEAVLEPDLVRTGLRRLQFEGLLRSSMSPTAANSTSRVSALESGNYMRNQLLRDADWASMAHGIEVRTPLVDIEFLRAVSPIVPHLRPGDGKRLLAEAPGRHLPGSVTNAGKLGFSVPTQSWMAKTGGGELPTRGSASRSWSHKIYRQFDETGPVALQPQPAGLVPDTAPSDLLETA